MQETLTLETLRLTTASIAVVWSQTVTSSTLLAGIMMKSNFSLNLPAAATQRQQQKCSSSSSASHAVLTGARMKMTMSGIYSLLQAAATRHHAANSVWQWNRVPRQLSGTRMHYNTHPNDEASIKYNYDHPMSGLRIHWAYIPGLSFQLSGLVL
jgi:hypothetical protein